MVAIQNQLHSTAHFKERESIMARFAQAHRDQIHESSAGEMEAGC